MKNIRVLYAEDDLSNRKIMEHKLKNEGIECITVINGEEAIQSYAKEHFDVVILDKLMPNKNDGIEALLEIKKLNNNVKSICLTSDDWDTKNLTEAGFDLVFIKPIIGNNFIEQLLKLHETTV